MNYDLGLELKNAGFPQDTQWAFVDKDGHPKNLRHTLMVVDAGGRMNLTKDGYHVVGAPTLEELIEACGIVFDSLVRGTGNSWWTAVSTAGEAQGETPVEAVAHLWLALHSKARV